MKPVALPSMLLLTVSLAACGGNDNAGDSAFQDAVGQDNSVTPVTPQGQGPALKQGPDFADLQLGPVITSGAGAAKTAQFKATSAPPTQRATTAESAAPAASPSATAAGGQVKS